jgi:hypothetical protein
MHPSQGCHETCRGWSWREIAAVATFRNAIVFAQEREDRIAGGGSRVRLRVRHATQFHGACKRELSRACRVERGEVCCMNPNKKEP